MTQHADMHIKLQECKCSGWNIFVWLFLKAWPPFSRDVVNHDRLPAFHNHSVEQHGSHSGIPKKGRNVIMQWGRLSSTARFRRTWFTTLCIFRFAWLPFWRRSGISGGELLHYFVVNGFCDQWYWLGGRLSSTAPFTRVCWPIYCFCWGAHGLNWSCSQLVNPADTVGYARQGASFEQFSNFSLAHLT